MQQWLIKHVEKKTEIHSFYMFKLVVKVRMHQIE